MTACGGTANQLRKVAEVGPQDERGVSGTVAPVPQAAVAGSAHESRAVSWSLSPQPRSRRAASPAAVKAATSSSRPSVKWLQLS